jgi:hypothetical protein
MIGFSGSGILTRVSGRDGSGFRRPLPLPLPLLLQGSHLLLQLLPEAKFGKHPVPLATAGVVSGPGDRPDRLVFKNDRHPVLPPQYPFFLVYPPEFGDNKRKVRLVENPETTRPANRADFVASGGQKVFDTIDGIARSSSDFSCGQVGHGRISCRSEQTPKGFSAYSVPRHKKSAAFNVAKKISKST